MRENTIKALWRAGKPAAIGWMGSPDPYMAEAMANAGLDGLVLDMQHGMGIGSDRAVQWLQVVSATKTLPIVRAPWNDPVAIQHVLDAGAMGVIVPLVRTYAETVKAVGAARYAPVGYRSVGPNRARFMGADYIERANDEVFCLVMVETEDTIPNLSEMVTVPGLDGFYIGPSDLAVSLGLKPGPAAIADPRHAGAVKATLEAAQKAGLVCGCHTSSPDEAVRRFREGFLMSPVATDVGLVTAGTAAALDRVRTQLA